MTYQIKLLNDVKETMDAVGATSGLINDPAFKALCFVVETKLVQLEQLITALEINTQNDYSSSNP